jgi:flagellar biosynthetic protein FliR
MDAWLLSYQEFKGFFLIFIRVSVILFMLPFFNARAIPVLSKAGLAFLMTIILVPVVDSDLIASPENLWGLAQIVLSEFAIGMILGLMTNFFFEGVRIMGQLVGFQTGFAITNVLDPQRAIQVSILSNTAYLLAVVLFLLLNGHHILIDAIRESFDIIKIGSIQINTQLFQKIIEMSGSMFIIGIKIGSPAIAALLFTKVAFGLVTKMIPQMNIMIVAFPVQIFIGLLFFGVSLNLLLGFTENYLSGLRSLLLGAMTWIRV